jgi:hypothetical protein
MERSGPLIIVGVQCMFYRFKTRLMIQLRFPVNCDFKVLYSA